jgi:hypothetical protein
MLVIERHCPYFAALKTFRDPATGAVGNPHHDLRPHEGVQIAPANEAAGGHRIATEHPSTATSLDNLAGLLQAQSDLAGAWPFQERALAIYEKALGPEHPSTAASLSNLAGLLQA